MWLTQIFTYTNQLFIKDISGNVDCVTHPCSNIFFLGFAPLKTFTKLSVYDTSHVNSPLEALALPPLLPRLIYHQLT